MQPSRDDFVIAIRSAFLSKSAQQRFSLLLVIFFSLILISLSKFNFKAIDYVRMSFKEIAYRSSFIVSIPENSASTVLNLRRRRLIWLSMVRSSTYIFSP